MNVIEAVQKELDRRGYKDVKITRQTDGNKAGIGIRSPTKSVAVACGRLYPGETLDDRTEDTVRAVIWNLFDGWDNYDKYSFLKRATADQEPHA